MADNMREPDFELDGWCLEDGEAIHREAPKTFWIPDQARREGLQAGDLAKLIFRISVADKDEPVAVERMWVVVRERLSGSYLGILDNDPYAITENDDLWSGVEIPFAARHIIDVRPRDEDTIESANRLPRKRWQSQ
jgi:hypothetical protein